MANKPQSRCIVRVVPRSAHAQPRERRKRRKPTQSPGSVACPSSPSSGTASRRLGSRCSGRSDRGYARAPCGDVATRGEEVEARAGNRARQTFLEEPFVETDTLGEVVGDLPL